MEKKLAWENYSGGGLSNVLRGGYLPEECPTAKIEKVDARFAVSHKKRAGCANFHGKKLHGWRQTAQETTGGLFPVAGNIVGPPHSREKRFVHVAEREASNIVGPPPSREKKVRPCCR
jgi:hypothetical protein